MCRSLKRSCVNHFGWEKLRQAELDLERLNLVSWSCHFHPDMRKSSHRLAFCSNLSIQQEGILWEQRVTGIHLISWTTPIDVDEVWQKKKKNQKHEKPHCRGLTSTTVRYNENCAKVETLLFCPSTKARFIHAHCLPGVHTPMHSQQSAKAAVVVKFNFHLMRAWLQTHASSSLRLSIVSILRFVTICVSFVYWTGSVISGVCVCVGL